MGLNQDVTKASISLTTLTDVGGVPSTFGRGLG